jgi:hypothetical protein
VKGDRRCYPQGMTDEEDDPVDRVVATPRVPSGSFMIFSTRAHVLKDALKPCAPRTRDAALVLEGLRVEIEAVIVECGRWPKDMPDDPTERLAWSATMGLRVAEIEARVKSFLGGGR